MPFQERVISTGLLILTSVLLFFALTLPIITFSVNGESLIGVIRQVAPSMNDMTDEDIFLLGESFLEVDLASLNILNEFSVISGATELWKQGSYFPAILILLFSVIFPIFKLGVSWLLALRGVLPDLNKALSAVHRVSMLDVFVVAIIVFVISRSTGYEVAFGQAFYIYVAYFFSHLVTSAYVGKVAAGD